MWVIVHAWVCTCGSEECAGPETAAYGPFKTEDAADAFLETIDYDENIDGCAQVYNVEEVLDPEEIGIEDEDEPGDDEDEDQDDEDEDEE